MNSAHLPADFAPREDSLTGVIVARGSEWGAVTIHGLTAEEAKIQGSIALTCGEQIRILIDLGDRPIRMSAQVARVDEQGDFPVATIQFTNVSEPAKDSLQGWLHAA